MKHSTLRPMLAATASFEEIVALLPLIATPKIDGIRCLIKDGKLYSRSLKPIPNRFINAELGNKPRLNGLDGELIVGPLPGNFQETTSGVRREGGEPDFTFWYFDQHDKPSETYVGRIFREVWNEPRAQRVKPTVIDTPAELLVYETKQLDLGFEGVILRSAYQKYKFGRSTLAEAGMLKLKRFEDSEATILGYEPEMLNTNTAMKNELGRTKRSSAKAGMVAKDTLGNLILYDAAKGWKFSVGSGFNDAEAARLWAVRDKLIGLKAKYRYFPIGIKDGPRFPTYLGIREDWDMP